jgi:hypothetical protein
VPCGVDRFLDIEESRGHRHIIVEIKDDGSVSLIHSGVVL